MWERNPLIAFGACVLAVIPLAMALANVRAHPHKSDPNEVICWQVDGVGAMNSTPAYLGEHTLLRDMQHETAVSLFCSGTIAGHYAEWTASQVWIKRRGDHERDTH